jgi:hypothetical protein
MSEDHQIVSQAQGEPLPEGCTGVRVRVQLSGCPTPRWSRDLAARLSGELVGHAAVGHLRLNVNDLVQTDHIVLEGVEASEAPLLGGALERAIDATNRASAQDEANPPANVSRVEADRIARAIELHDT